jgi:hypothetical protein
MPAQLRPPEGLPGSISGSDNEAWSTLVRTQLESVTKTAENWRTGLVALIGVIAGFSLIKGPDNLSGLASWAAYTVGVLLLLALASAVFGTWASLAAAYGIPRTVSREEFKRIGGIDGFRLQAAANRASRLFVARLATIVTILLLAAAIGLTWYGPRPRSFFLQVERHAQPSLCGEQISSENGYIEIRPSGSSATKVKTSEVQNIRAVKECR